MKVKEFIAVVPYSLVDYADIYEMEWDENFQEYFSGSPKGRVHCLHDLDAYLEYELDYFDYQTMYGEYDGSALYIKMPRRKETV